MQVSLMTILKEIVKNDQSCIVIYLHVIKYKILNTIFNEALFIATKSSLRLRKHAHR